VSAFAVLQLVALIALLITHSALARTWPASFGGERALDPVLRPVEKGISASTGVDPATRCDGPLHH
jgi:hypothetical protein